MELISFTMNDFCLRQTEQQKNSIPEVQQNKLIKHMFLLKQNCTESMQMYTEHHNIICIRAIKDMYAYKINYMLPTKWQEPWFWDSFHTPPMTNHTESAYKVIKLSSNVFLCVLYKQLDTKNQ